MTSEGLPCLSSKGQSSRKRVLDRRPGRQGGLLAGIRAKWHQPEVSLTLGKPLCPESGGQAQWHGCCPQAVLPVVCSCLATISGRPWKLSLSLSQALKALQKPRKSCEAPYHLSLQNFMRSFPEMASALSPQPFILPVIMDPFASLGLTLPIGKVGLVRNWAAQLAFILLPQASFLSFPSRQGNVGTFLINRLGKHSGIHAPP